MRRDTIFPRKRGQGLRSECSPRSDGSTEVFGWTLAEKPQRATPLDATLRRAAVHRTILSYHERQSNAKGLPEGADQWNIPGNTG
ncbi:MAG: hypothetical protein C0183_17085 [Roseiflexus castenholzii]|nr:MAG: hypothetical protein C0183_17085 [Roseiflexus castenholzii]